jgi:hypothetical protein
MSGSYGGKKVNEITIIVCYQYEEFAMVIVCCG